MQKIVWSLYVAFSTLGNHLYGQQAPWFNTEPTLNFDVHDPAIIKDASGRYTLTSTNNLLTLRQSADLMNWTTPGRVLNTLPAWAVRDIPGVENLWAPHIVFMGGRYYAYYSASSFGSNDSGIGVASSATLDPASPGYGWTDHGIVILSEGQNFNAIDPEVVQDQNGNWWMVFGSFWSTGIRMVQINPNTGKRTAENNTIHALADRNGGAIEGPSMIYHNGFYYLFVAYDACCQGVNSTYRTMVGRSASITGPFVDKQGNDMRNNAATEVLAGYDRYRGTGHGSVFKDNRRDYFVHHYYNANRNGYPTPQIREIVWGADGWPVLSQPFLGRRQAYEAEHARLVNAQIISGANSSAGSYVGYINYQDSRVNFHINALQAGNYTVLIRYAAGGGAATQLLSVNGSEQEVKYPATAAWGTFPQGQTVKVSVSLQEGYNLLSFRPGSGFAELDRIDLWRSAGSVIEAGSFDDGVGASYVSSGNNASLANNSWSKFEYVDFGNGGFNTLAIKAGGNCSGALRFNIDGVNATPDATAIVSLTAGQTYNLSLPSSFSALTNTHDVYYTYTGSQACVLDDIQFAASTADCNGTLDGSASADLCGRCVGGTTGKTACEGADEAETVACAYEGVTENVNAGYKGTGYINGANAAGSGITFSIHSAGNVNATLSLRYATSTGRPAQLSVNGADQPVVLQFPSTGNFTTWMIEEFTVQLVQGNNMVTLSATTAEGLANIDQIGYVSSSLSAGTCVVTGIKDESSDRAGWVYPNPSSGGFHVREAGDFSYQVLTLDGQEMEAGTGNYNAIVGEDLPPGFYILKIFGAAGNSIVKIYKVQ